MTPLRIEVSDPALSHELAERVVLPLGLGHPQHVVEEQVLGIRRGEPRMLETGSVKVLPAVSGASESVAVAGVVSISCVASVE